MKKLLALAFVLICFSVGRGQITSQNARRIISGTAVPTATCVPGPPWRSIYIRTTDNSEYHCTAAPNVWTKVTSGSPAGDVVGPGSSTDNAIVRFDSTTGKLLQNSVVTVADTTGAIAGSQSISLSGSSSGALLVKPAAAAGSNTLTLPAGTTDFSATGGTSQVVKQTSSGGGFTVARLACADLSDAGAGCTITFGTGVQTALGVNVGTAGSFVVNGGALGSPSSAGTLPAHTLGGTVSGGGNQINNVIIGTSTPLAGSFTTLAVTTSATIPKLGLGASAADATALLFSAGGILNFSGSSTLAWSSGYTAIMLGGNGGIANTTAQGAGGGLDLAMNAYFDGTNWKAISTEAATDFAQTGGTMLWRTAPSVSAGSTATFTTQMTLTNVGNLKMGGSAVRGTTEGTNHLDIFNGTAPVGTLTNGVSLYAAAGELRSMDAAGNSTLLSPHDHVTNEWIYYSVNTVTGRVLKIDMERLMRTLDLKLGGGFVHEYMSEAEARPDLQKQEK